MEQIKFRSRAVTSLLMLFGFLVLVVSGVVLYAAPRGRTARDIDWQVLFLEKAEWSNLHLVFGAVFIIAGFYHLALNRHPLFSYFRQKMRQGTSGTRRAALRLEPVVALAVALLLIGTAIGNAPPASYLVDLHHTIVDSWDPSVGDFGRGGGERWR